MNARWTARVVLMVVTLSCTLAAVGAEPPPITHNPFSRPPSTEATSEIASSTGLRESAALIQLNATMVAPGSRLANVEGRILRPGDDFKGYTLRFVYEDRAIFERGTSELTVFVRPDLDHEVDE